MSLFPFYFDVSIYPAIMLSIAISYAQATMLGKAGKKLMYQKDKKVTKRAEKRHHTADSLSWAVFLPYRLRKKDKTIKKKSGSITFRIEKKKKKSY